MRKLKLAITIALFAATGVAMSQTDQRRYLSAAESERAKEVEIATQALISLTKRMEGDKAAEKLAAQFRDGVIKFGNTEENAETDNWTKKIVLSEKAIEQIVKSRDGGKTVNFGPTADWAATIQHEWVHQGQGYWFTGISNIRQGITGGNPMEMEGWRAGFNAMLRWAYKERGKMDSSGEFERRTAASEVNAICLNFETYAQNYKQAKFETLFSTLDLIDHEGNEFSLARALVACGEMRKRAAEIIGGKFTVITSPRILPNQPQGQVYELMAEVRSSDVSAGGSTPPRLASANFTFEWYAGGVKMTPAGDTFRRTAKQSEKITVVAASKTTNGKAEFVCMVTVKPKDNKELAALYKGVGTLYHVLDGVDSFCVEKVNVTVSLLPTKLHDRKDNSEKSKVTLEIGKWTHRSAYGKCLERGKKESYEIYGDAIIEDGKCWFNTGLGCVFNAKRVHTAVYLHDRYKGNGNSDNHAGQYPVGGKMEDCEYRGKVECVQLELSFDIPRAN
jgi:hypothetical protein